MFGCSESIQLNVLLLTTRIDCCSTDGDSDVNQFSTYEGYYKNNPGFQTTIGCLGTCIEKLALGSDCSRSTVNIHALDSTILLTGSADDNACKSGKYICRSCASTTSKVANGQR